MVRYIGSVLMGLLVWVMPGEAVIGQAEMLEPGLPVKAEIAADEVQRLEIILDSYSYRPNHVVVEVGKPVELTLISVTSIIPHNFVMPDSLGAISVEQDVGAGKRVTVRFTPHQPGQVPFFCNKRLWPMASHRDKGMEGMLEVR